LNVWWRDEPLISREQYLLEILYRAHRQSCFRPNPSSVTAINAAIGSGDIGKAVAAAILTLGGKHAPLEQTVRFLAGANPAGEVDSLLRQNRKVPGWGGSFQQDGIDPIWSGVASSLEKWHPDIMRKLNQVTLELHQLGKAIYPNPSAFTAAVVIALKVPAKLAVYLFISARLDAWAEIAWRQETEGEK
jgi:citrate synthase